MPCVLVELQPCDGVDVGWNCWGWTGTPISVGKRGRRAQSRYQDDRRPGLEEPRSFELIYVSTIVGAQQGCSEVVDVDDKRSRNRGWVVCA